MKTALFTLASIGVGYVLGRVRPWRQAGIWTDWRFMGLMGRRPLGYRDALALLVFRPRRAIDAWRHRHDPPKKPVPVSDTIRPRGGS